MASNAPNTLPLRAAIFASGNGTNAENILKHCAGNKGLDIALILTDQPYAGVIQRAKAFNVPYEIVPRLKDSTKEDHEAAIVTALDKYKVEWIFLAGYMRILSADFLRHFHDKALGVNRIVNIHPSLLPAFPGKDSYLAAFNAGVKVSGVTLHFVDDEVDSGPIILQKAFARNDEEDFDSFRARGMALEYDIYQEFLKHLSTGDWSVKAIPGSQQKIVCLGKEGKRA